jgi:hypothetical protein
MDIDVEHMSQITNMAVCVPYLFFIIFIGCVMYGGYRLFLLYNNKNKQNDDNQPSEEMIRDIELKKIIGRIACGIRMKTNNDKLNAILELLDQLNNKTDTKTLKNWIIIHRSEINKDGCLMRDKWKGPYKYYDDSGLDPELAKKYSKFFYYF